MPNLFLFLVMAQLLPTSEFVPTLIRFFSSVHYLAEFLSIWDSKVYSDSPCVWFFFSYLNAIISFSRLSLFEILWKSYFHNINAIHWINKVIHWIFFTSFPLDTLEGCTSLFLEFKYVHVTCFAKENISRKGYESLMNRNFKNECRTCHTHFPLLWRL